MPRIRCVAESYHSTDPWNDHAPINLEHGQVAEVSRQKADACRELDGVVTVEAGR